MKDKDGNIVLEKHKRLTRWKEYITELFEHVRPPMSSLIEESSYDEPVDPISEYEVFTASKNMKSGKAVGPDIMQCELIKLLQSNRPALMFVVKFFNSVLSKGIIPKDWLKSTFIMKPKKTNARDCGDYRTISLMSHILKIFLKIIHQRIYKKCDENAGTYQLRFISGYGTREAICALNILAQRCRDVRHELYCCFIDYQKAFDCVKTVDGNTETNWHQLGNSKIYIANLYWNQIAIIRNENEETEKISIKKGVRQGCILSPVLFNIYSESIFKQALNEDDGIAIGTEHLSNIRYGDDIVLVADSFENLQDMLIRSAHHTDYT